MAITVYCTAIVLAFLSFLFKLHWSCNRKSPIRMVPQLLLNATSIHEYATQVLRRSGWTYNVKGPWFTNMNFVLTCDPMNVHHICSKNFANYPKGPEFREIFEPLGNGIFNADGEMWKIQRKILHSLLKNNKYESALVRTIHKKVENGLIPVLDHASELEKTLDLQEVFQRFTFDNICQLVLGSDPASLSVEFPPNEYEQAYNKLEEGILYRQIVPVSCWKLQKWLQIGEEKKFSRAWRAFDTFLYECISLKKERLSQRKANKEEEEFDLLTAFMKEEEVIQDGLNTGNCLKITDEFLRDVAFNLIGAGRDTVSSCLTWFFWLVATHPSVESRLLEEINANVGKDGEEERICRENELNKFVYLHAALCETLRLYPPVPFNHKTAAESETLPSGHRVNRNERILLSYYSMARMEEIWGKDCAEFKPERWISKREDEDQRIVHIPSYKFTAFHAGPRNCLGKEQSLIQIKMVAIVIIKNYHVRVVEGHPVSPSDSIVLHMKHGLKVGISKRQNKY